MRASDYTLYRDPKGIFHVVPHDMNETFSPAMGFGFGKGPKGGKDAKDAKEGKEGKGGKGPGGIGMSLDPLIGLEDARKPLRSKLLAVPALKKRYLENVRTIAQTWLDWNKLQPTVAQYRKLIEAEVEIDSRKLYSLAEFKSSVADEAAKPGSGGFGRGVSLRSFAEQRRAFLLNHAAIQQLEPMPEKK